MFRKITSAYPSYIRLSHWWYYKAAPIIGLFYLMVYLNGIDLSVSLLLLGASLITIIGIAGLGYFLNDLSDIEYDRRVNKINRISQLTSAQRILLVVGLIACAGLPWLYLPGDSITWVLIAFQLLLYIVYSFPPFRFKERGMAGIICDSLYGLTVPASLAVYTYHLIGDGTLEYFRTFLIVLFLTLVVKGIRNILIHQIEDRRNDKKSGTKTMVLQLGGGKAVRMINQIISPVEFILLTTWVIVVSISVPLFWISLVVFAIFHLLKIGAWGMFGLTRRQLHFKFLYALNDYYEQWLPIYSLALLITLDWRFLVFLLTTFIFFPEIPFNVYSGAKKIVENLKKLLKGDYGKWWSRHGQFMYQKNYAVSKFVFVTCGPGRYINQLQFSLKALSRFTRNEIIVITDSSRNEIPIHWKSIVDVKTPSSYNHREASIFLKTSVHKFLPKEYRYCCLDSNIIALSNGVDEIFNNKLGPITFAPDGKRLREFSPHAVNCGCVPSDDNFQGNDLKFILKQRAFLKKLELEKRGWINYIIFLLRFNLSRKTFKLDGDNFYDKDKKYWFDSKGKLIYRDRGNTETCNHLKFLIYDKFNIKITEPNWHHWNSGVFLFDESSEKFMDNWHQKTIKIFNDKKWKTEDQGTLIATVWEMGLEKQYLLTKRFNFISDFFNGRLMTIDNDRLSDDGGKSVCSPVFINIRYFFGVKGWDVWDWLEHKLSPTT